MNNTEQLSSVRRHGPDYLIVFCVAFLLLFGLVMLSSASSNISKNKFEDSYYYLRHQLMYGLSFGIIGFLAASRVYYGNYQKWAFYLLGASVVAMLLIFTPLGFKAGGASRWLTLGPITIQPAELLKVTFLLYLAAWLSGNPNRQSSLIGGFLPFIAMLGGIGVILLKQSTTSTFAIIILTACTVYFLSGARWIYLFSTLTLGISAILAVSYFTPYRWTRLMTFINPNANYETSGYHINQAQIAIGSGGLAGVGLGQSTTKISYLPEPIGDSIFAVIAEELGFIGGAAVIGLFALLCLRTLILAPKVKNKFGSLLLVGFGTLIGIQAFVNIGAISGVIPLTGMPLPFVSYGGTALAVYMTMAGIITNVSKYTA